MSDKREGYEDYMKRKDKETRGRKPKFASGRKTMAVDFEPKVHKNLAELSQSMSEKAGKHISKGELIRAAVAFWIENKSPYSVKL